MWRRPWLVALGALTTLATSVAAANGINQCNERVCTTVTRKDTVDTYTISTSPENPLGPGHFGWLAVGWGDQMPNSPLIVMWPNEDGTFTLSQRKAPSHTMPHVDPNPPRVATLETERCYTNATGTSFTFTIEAEDKHKLMVWAMGLTNPGNSDVHANLIQHTWHGAAFLTLDAPMPEEPTVLISGSSKATDPKTGKPSLALIAHVTCGVLVTLLVLPGGVVLPRITRGLTTSKWWFYFHMLNQGFFALVLVAAGFGIALTFGGEIDSAHRKTGTALFALVLLQIVIGCVAHFYKPGHRVQNITFETKRGRGPSNFLHVVLGIITVAVGWSACWSGFTVEWTRRGHGVPAHGLRIGWAVICVVWILAYVLGIFFFLPRQLKIESSQRATDLAEQKKYFPSEFDLKVRNEPITPTPPQPISADRDSPSGLAVAPLSPSSSNFAWSSPDTSINGHRRSWGKGMQYPTPPQASTFGRSTTRPSLDPFSDSQGAIAPPPLRSFDEPRPSLSSARGSARGGHF